MNLFLRYISKKSFQNFSWISINYLRYKYYLVYFSKSVAIWNEFSYIIHDNEILKYYNDVNNVSKEMNEESQKVYIEGQQIRSA